jgi:hypothetical protein
MANTHVETRGLNGARARLAAAVHKGATPEKAVDRAQVHYWNTTRPPFERTRPKRGPG